MKQISDVIGKFKSVYSAAKHYNVLANQIARLIKAGAIVDESGQVWIKSKTRLVGAPKNQYFPDYAVSPGSILIHDMSERGHDVPMLSFYSGITCKIMYEIIRGQSAITPEIAAKLEKCGWGTAEYWLNLEKNYQEALSKVKE